MAIIFPFDLFNPLGDLGKIKMFKGCPVGMKKISMGIQVGTLVILPHTSFMVLFQEMKKVQVQRFNSHVIRRHSPIFSG
jgi:hypothetical protein